MQSTGRTQAAEPQRSPRLAHDVAYNTRYEVEAQCHFDGAVSLCRSIPLHLVSLRLQNDDRRRSGDCSGKWFWCEAWAEDVVVRQAVHRELSRLEDVVLVMFWRVLKSIFSTLNDLLESGMKSACFHSFIHVRLQKSSWSVYQAENIEKFVFTACILLDAIHPRDDNWFEFWNSFTVLCRHEVIRVSSYI